ncbi:uncharacterized protein [Palaemon carinicauda]|uniref:uncharacterized protein n=1 Tax=Palaemon carinicauda TaxID=392227 RepID=UPI0035B604B0
MSAKRSRTPFIFTMVVMVILSAKCLLYFRREKISNEILSDQYIGDNATDIDEEHSRQKRFLFFTSDRKLSLPPGTLLNFKLTLALNALRNGPVGYVATLTSDYDFTIATESLGYTSAENPWFVLPFLYLNGGGPGEDSVPGVNLAGGDRVMIFQVIEDIIETVGLLGKPCVQRAICEIFQGPLRNHGFLGEVLKLLFSVSRAAYAEVRLSDYLAAEKAGKETGDCSFYTQLCLHSLFSNATAHPPPKLIPVTDDVEGREKKDEVEGREKKDEVDGREKKDEVEGRKKKDEVDEREKKDEIEGREKKDEVDVREKKDEIEGREMRDEVDGRQKKNEVEGREKKDEVAGRDEKFEVEGREEKYEEEEEEEERMHKMTGNKEEVEGKEKGEMEEEEDEKEKKDGLSRQKRFLYYTRERRLTFPPGSDFFFIPTLSIPFRGNNPPGYALDALQVTVRIQLDLDDLGITSEENPFGFWKIFEDELEEEIPARRKHVLTKRSDSRFPGGDREMLYAIVEDAIHNAGLQGKPCLLRAICEMFQYPLDNHGFFGEVLELFLSASLAPNADKRLPEYVAAERAGKTTGKCFAYHDECPYSLFTNPMDSNIIDEEEMKKDFSEERKQKLEQQSLLNPSNMIAALIDFLERWL